MFGFLKKILAVGATPPSAQKRAGTLGVDELARRLGVTEHQLRSIPLAYAEFRIPKRSRRGGVRTILAPSSELKFLQRRILRRLLSQLKAHASATGFEQGHSIVTNALLHFNQDVVIRLDLKEFFASTPAVRVEAYFGYVGWNAEAAAMLTKLCTYRGALPQGAPTSPRLSNLVNYRLDARLAALAAQRGLSYSRYADDITFSGDSERGDESTHRNPKTLERVRVSGARPNDVIHGVKQIVADEGYELHTDKKLRISRRHDRQIVTGLVVNVRPNLPRATRRRLRAVEHRLRTCGQATLTAEQLAGWRALQKMIET
jgi:hypothetical protein